MHYFTYKKTKTKQKPVYLIEKEIKKMKREKDTLLATKEKRTVSGWMKKKRYADMRRNENVDKKITKKSNTISELFASLIKYLLYLNYDQPFINCKLVHERCKEWQLLIK